MLLQRLLTLFEVCRVCPKRMYMIGGQASIWMSCLKIELAFSYHFFQGSPIINILDRNLKLTFHSNVCQIVQHPTDFFLQLLQVRNWHHSGWHDRTWSGSEMKTGYTLIEGFCHLPYAHECLWKFISNNVLILSLLHGKNKTVLCCQLPIEMMAYKMAK